MFTFKFPKLSLAFIVVVIHLAVFGPMIIKSIYRADQKQEYWVNQTLSEEKTISQIMASHPMDQIRICKVSIQGMGYAEFKVNGDSRSCDVAVREYMKAHESEVSALMSNPLTPVVGKLQDELHVVKQQTKVLCEGKFFFRSFFRPKC